MPSSSPASVIVSSYNDLAILESSLAALSIQSFRDFELVIADDGSSQDYAPTLAAWAPRFPHGIQHVTQEKKGFRRARILNRAIHVSRFDRVIFLDMDCLPHRDFVGNHLAYLQTGTAITGRRVDISRDAVPTTEQIRERGLGFSPPALLRLWLQGKAKRIEHGFVSPIFYESTHAALIGCNFSLHKSDLQSLNGFNEEFEGWGGEDTELDLRLHFMGAKIRNLRNKVIEYHLTHEHREVDAHQVEAVLQRTRAEKSARARQGLAQIRESDFSRASFAPAK
jgi:GT2 family glycosyltransferase